MDPTTLILPLVALAIALGIFYATVRARTTERVRKEARLAADEGPEITLGTDDGLCRIAGCGRHAQHRAPRIVSVRPTHDWLLRRLGATPMVKFQLQMQPKELDAPVDLCEDHQALARCALEIELGEIPSRYARLNNDVLRHMTSYHRNELYTRLESDAMEDSKRKKRRGGQASNATASVVDISQKRASNNGSA